MKISRSQDNWDRPECLKKLRIAEKTCCHSNFCRGCQFLQQGKTRKDIIVITLVVFYGISSLVVYLILNPIYSIYINMICNELFVGNAILKRARSNSFANSEISPIGKGCRIPTASLQWRKTPPPREWPGYVTKQLDGQAPLMLELWGMQSNPSLPSLQGLLWSGEVVPDRVLSMGQIMINWILWNRFVGSFNCA